MRKYLLNIIVLAFFLVIFPSCFSITHRVKLAYVPNPDYNPPKGNPNIEITVNKFLDTRKSPIMAEWVVEHQRGGVTELVVHHKMIAKTDVSEWVTSAVIQELQRVDYKVKMAGSENVTSGLVLSGSIEDLDKSEFDGDARLTVRVVLKKGNLLILEKSYTGRGEKFTITVSSPKQLSMALNDFLIQLVVDIVFTIQKYY